jgi:hypothetical protein
MPSAGGEKTKRPASRMVAAYLTRILMINLLESQYSNQLLEHSFLFCR